MAEVKGGRPPIDDSERLTYSDLGADLKEIARQNEDASNNNKIGPVPESMRPTTREVTDLSEYRAQKNPPEVIVTPPTAQPTKKNKTKKAVAVAMGALALGGATKFAHDAVVARPEPVMMSVPETPLTIEEFPAGKELEVSAFSYTITGPNVRISPKVTDDNLLDHTDLTGQTIVRPIEVNDELTAQNGDWLEFVDSKGNLLFVNDQNVERIEDSNRATSPTQHVTITKTSNLGMFASDEKGNIVQVATVIASQ